MYSKFQCWRCDMVTSVGKKCSTCGMAYYCTDRCRINDEFRHNSSDCKDVAVRYVCHACKKKTTEQMKMCSNCMQVWFCSRECQTQAWKTHKDGCQKISSSVVRLSLAVQKKYDFLKSIPVGMPVTYYWGNSPALDLLNLPMNEGLEYKESLSLLLCGVGDPRNVCLTLSKLEDTEYRGKVTFVMNDICACTLARTVLLLYLLCRGGDVKAESVTQIWYSLFLSDEDHQFVVTGLRDLIQISNLEVITHGIMKMDADQFNRLKNVWKTWLDLSSKKIDILGQRGRSAKQEEKRDRWGIECYLGKMPAKHRTSVKDWFKHGMLSPKNNRSKLTKENITLTGSSVQWEKNTGSFGYTIPACSFPYQGWDYKDVVAVYPKLNCVNEMYNKYITSVLRKCAARLTSDDIQLSFILSNCTDVTPHLPEGVAYDRITMSNLWDFIPLPNLLSMGKPLLNPLNNSAVVVTATQNWFSFSPTDLLETKLSRMDLFPFSEMREKVLKDTGGRSDIAYSDDNYAFIEYHSFKAEFNCFLRASLLLSNSSHSAKSMVPSVNQLARELGLKPRDFIYCENKVSRFRWLLNSRRVTLMLGYARAVEWVLFD